jgi:transcriptional regulator with XRE-family HTH domain
VQGLTQKDLCAFLGWRDINRLSDIEQNRVKPGKEVLMDILTMLNVPPEVRGQALLLFGEPPTEEEARAWKTRLQGDEGFESTSIPIMCIDFIRKIHLINQAALTLLHLAPAGIEREPNLLELLFNPRSDLHQHLKKTGEWEQVAKRFVARFKTEQITQLGRRMSEPCLIPLFKRLFPYPEFGRVWGELDDYTARELCREVPLIDCDRIGISGQTYHVSYQKFVLADWRFLMILFLQTH